MNDTPYAQYAIEAVALKVTPTVEDVTNTVLQRVMIELSHQGIPSGFSTNFHQLRTAVRKTVIQAMADGVARGIVERLDTQH